MSRTGNRPVPFSDKVKTRVADSKVFIEGPHGKHEIPIAEGIGVVVKDNAVLLSRPDDTNDSKRLHGLMRALISSAIKGVSESFQKVLLIEGIGYRADLKGSLLNLSLGYSHPIEYQIPTGVKAQVEKQTKIILTGGSSALVGQVAANVRAFRPPEPYKGKGIRYEGEVIQRKAGKAASAGK